MIKAKAGANEKNIKNLCFIHMCFYSETFLRTRDLFVEAARLAPSDPDPDVQCGLGVLFNLSNDYDKAIDCFRVSVAAKRR